jgi:hypothetical protein
MGCFFITISPLISAEAGAMGARTVTFIYHYFHEQAKSNKTYTTFNFAV